MTRSEQAQEELAGQQYQDIASRSHKEMNIRSKAGVVLADERPDYTERKENAVLTGHSASSRSKGDVLPAPFSVKSVTGIHHDLMFIDDDAEIDDHYAKSRLRTVRDHNDNSLQVPQCMSTQNTDNDFSRNIEAEKSERTSEKSSQSLRKCTNLNDGVHVRIGDKKIAGNVEGEDRDEAGEPVHSEEFKKCSITEKIYMRKAQIVGGASATSVDALDITRQPMKCIDLMEAGANGYSNTFENLKAIREVKRNDRQQERKTNTVSKTRDKESEREREKRQKGKNNVISDCNVQITQSLQLRTSDKEERSSSLLADVYSGDKDIAKQNISSGLGSVKDKQHPKPTKSFGSEKTRAIDSKLSKADNESKLCDLEQAILQDLGVQPNHNKTIVTTSVAVPEGVDRNLVVEANIKDIPNVRKDDKANQTISHLTPAEVLAKRERNSIRRIKSRSRAANHIRKQKSLRQQIFRKLGSNILLSSSTPDLNATDSELDDSPGVLKAETLSTPAIINLRRHSAFRGKDRHRRSSSPVLGPRSLSEGDILEAVDDEPDGRSMRTFKNIRKISQDDFIETYGVMPKKNGKNKNVEQHFLY